ncbi:MAG: aldo/keto reductase [Phycisphaeraceae bacterium]
MQERTLGRTGLRVSVLGLGAGGGSRLGQSTGHDVDHSVDIVLQAIDLGVNFIDTAEGYLTEPIVGRAIAQRDRSRLVISTKKTPARDGELITADQLAAGLERSLRHLGTDCIDIYHLHGLPTQLYEQARDELVPAMQRLRDQGKIRHIGVTEPFHSDPGHAMLAQAVDDDCWDVMMVGFNILNQSARERVLEAARRRDVGILDMFAVRNDLRQPEKLRQTVAQLIERGQIDAEAVDAARPLDWLLHDAGAVSLTDAAYRFCRDEPGVHVVLCGTGNPAHLRENVASIERGPLPSADRERAMQMFAAVDTVSGQ